MRRFRLVTGLAASFVLLGCSSDGGAVAGPSGGTGSSGASGSGGSGADAGPRPEGAPLAAGWQKAFAAESAGIDCTKTLDAMKAAGATSLTIGSATLVVGFEQIGENQDPVFARFDGGTKTYCTHHEREAPDGRAYGVTWDGGATAYVVYTIVGGGSAFDAKGKGQWLDRYGDGGGSAAVTFLGEVEAGSGTLVRGTFVIAKKQDGKTNTHKPVDAPVVTKDGLLEIVGESAFQPTNPDKSIMACTDYPFSTRYVFSRDMTTLVCASSTNCTAKAPCPAP